MEKGALMNKCMLRPASLTRLSAHAFDRSNLSISLASFVFSQAMQPHADNPIVVHRATLIFADSGQA
jgi:hypothetical protein